VKPWQTLSTAGPLTLKRRGSEFIVLTDGKILMGSKRHGSEDELAIKACESLGMPSPKVLIAGLGFGYTLRKALEVLPSGAHLTVAELSAPLVEWNQTIVGHLANHPLSDPRVELVIGDVRDALKRNDATFNAIMLDVDNGPFAISHEANAGLYSHKGLKLIHQALAAKGTAVVWSASDDAAFKRRLDDAHFATTKTWSIAGSQHVLFIAKK
jgi:spermidine synthase